MTLESIAATHKSKNIVQLFRQGGWLLLLISAALLMVLRTTVRSAGGTVAILISAVLIFALSFALRNAARTLMHRHTEDRIVNDVKTFLEREPAPAAPKPRAAKIAVIRQEVPDDIVPASAAGFLPLTGAQSDGTQPGDPVVFDVIPVREQAKFKVQFYAVLNPVVG